MYYNMIISIQFTFFSLSKGFLLRWCLTWAIGLCGDAQHFSTYRLRVLSNSDILPQHCSFLPFPPSHSICPTIEPPPHLLRQKYWNSSSVFQIKYFRNYIMKFVKIIVIPTPTFSCPSQNNQYQKKEGNRWNRKKKRGYRISLRNQENNKREIHS